MQAINNNISEQWQEPKSITFQELIKDYDDPRIKEMSIKMDIATNFEFYVISKKLGISPETLMNNMLVNVLNLFHDEIIGLLRKR